MNETEKELLEQMKRLNANLEILCTMIQSSPVAEALEIAKDIRFLLAKVTGHQVKK